MSRKSIIFLTCVEMIQKVEHLKLKCHGQRATFTKNRQEANLLVSAETVEPSSLRHLKTIQGLLEGKQAILKELDEEIIELCPLEEVEQETVDSEEISEAIIECTEQIMKCDKSRCRYSYSINGM